MSGNQIHILAGISPGDHGFAVLHKLVELLQDTSKTVLCVDQDTISKKMHAASNKIPSKEEVYAQMIEVGLNGSTVSLEPDAIERTTIAFSDFAKEIQHPMAQYDVVIYKGDIIGDLNLFRPYIDEVSSKGNRIICLDFRCDAQIQYSRLLGIHGYGAGSVTRDSKEFDRKNYIKNVHPTGVMAKDKGVAAIQDLVVAKKLELHTIDTTNLCPGDNAAMILSVLTQQPKSRGSNLGKKMTLVN